MKLTKCFRMALNMVLHSRLRSWLTIIGIVIAIASVIAIVGIGEGFNQEIMGDLGDLNADIITITPGYSKAQSFGPGRNRGDSSASSTAESDILDRSDYQTLKGINDIEIISPKISGSAEVYYLGEEGSVSVTGVDQKVYSSITSNEVSEGRLLDSADLNVVLIGGNLATKYFDREILLNKMITIEGKSFRVVGILDDSSNSVIMPINSAYDVLEKEKFEYDSIEIKIKDVDRLNQTEEIITTKLMRSRHVDEESQDFTVRTNAASNDFRAEMVSTITTFLTAIASISLIVGAVGVANTMFTSVLEKTKEIGIIKAIGGRNKDVLFIFLFNAGLIGLVGGIIGVVLGIGLSYIMSAVGLTSIVTFSSVLQTVFIAVLVGMVSGLIPAINASKMNPVDALRRE